MAINDTVPDYAAILSATFKRLEGHGIKRLFTLSESKKDKRKKDKHQIQFSLLLSHSFGVNGP